MRNVSIVGIGQTPVGEHWDRSIRHLGYDAVSAAMRDAHIERADALYVGNMMSGTLLGQEHLATLERAARPAAAPWAFLTECRTAEDAMIKVALDP